MHLLAAEQVAVDALHGREIDDRRAVDAREALRIELPSSSRSGVRMRYRSRAVTASVYFSQDWTYSTSSTATSRVVPASPTVNQASPGAAGRSRSFVSTFPSPRGVVKARGHRQGAHLIRRRPIGRCAGCACGMGVQRGPAYRLWNSPARRVLDSQPPRRRPVQQLSSTARDSRCEVN